MSNPNASRAPDQAASSPTLAASNHGAPSSAHQDSAASVATSAPSPGPSPATATGGHTRRVSHNQAASSGGNGSGTATPSLLPRPMATTTSSTSGSGTATAPVAVGSHHRPLPQPYGQPRRATSSATLAAATSAPSTAPGFEYVHGSRYGSPQHPASHAAPSSHPSAPETPPLFGNYSGGPPSLFTMTPATATASISTSAAHSARPATNLGFWRAPHRPAVAASHNVPRWPTVSSNSAHQAATEAARWAGNRSGTQSSASNFQENTVISFEWTIRDARLLRDEVEHTPTVTEEGRSVSAGGGRSEVWGSQPTFGEGRWKLELVRTKRTHPRPLVPGSEYGPSTPDITVLSVYLTSLVVENGPQYVALPTNVLLGIRPCSSRSSTNQSWVWTHFSSYTFQREAEFYECHELPSLSDLLETPAIASANAFELVVQLGAGPQTDFASKDSLSHRRMPFAMPSTRLVQDSIVAGLEGLIDCAATGDIAIVVRERGVVASGGPRAMHSGHDGGILGWEVLPWPVGTVLPAEPFEPSNSNGLHNEAERAGPETVIRERVIWAHSSILRSRSEYFRTMLDSGFAEGVGIAEASRGTHNQGGGNSNGRRIKMIRIPDADYATAQALVRYFYTGEIQFLEDEDVRSVTLDSEWMVESDQSSGPPVWAWQSLAQLAGEGFRASHRDGSPHTGHPGSTYMSPKHSQGGISGSGRGDSALRHSRSGSWHNRREGSGASGDGTRSYDASGGMGVDSVNASGSDNNMNDPMARAVSALLATDPHYHPAERSTPASALSIYRLAHRFQLPSLLHLAMSHLLSSLDANNAFPALLATQPYHDVHEAVRALVLEQWKEVSKSDEFERCCDEVSSGEWGADAGRALRALMRALSTSS